MVGKKGGEMQRPGVRISEAWVVEAGGADDSNCGCDRLNRSGLMEITKGMGSETFVKGVRSRVDWQEDETRVERWWRIKI